MKFIDSRGYILKSAFEFLEKLTKKNSKNAEQLLPIIADLIRYNTLISVARAGTGHLGASLSIIDIITEIYFRSFNFNQNNTNSINRDIFILSKGHAAPALYSVLAAKSYIQTKELDLLRRLHGLPGHCDIETIGVEANTGSLGMGLSKAVGHAIIKKRMNLGGNVIVIVGDGELQEGQCWEAFLSAVSFRCDNLYIIVDNNKVQTDQYTKDVVLYEDIINAIKNLGFYTIKCDGTKNKDIYEAFNSLKKIKDKPKLIDCQTIKGQGVSYMEHPNVLKIKGNRYIWHNKAPNTKELGLALKEIQQRIGKVIAKYGFYLNSKKVLVNIPICPSQTNISGDSIVQGLSDGLVRLAKKYKKLIILDADLEEDCGFISFRKTYPNRFFEMGIMEQHMVSSACAFSRQGYIPIFSSYAAFLTSRANEQLYNLASENGRAIIVGNMAGVIPATPGKSHQGFRDIACTKNIPGISMYQPITSDDSANVLKRYFNNDFGKILYIRLSITPSAIKLPSPSISLKKGRPDILRKGDKAIIVGIGPVVLGECLIATDDLSLKGVHIEVWNHPWLVDFDQKFYFFASKRNIPLIIIEDHYSKGGFGESLLSFLAKNNIKFPLIKHLAIKNFPKTGFRKEALQHLGLDRDNIASVISDLFK